MRVRDCSYQTSSSNFIILILYKINIRTQVQLKVITLIIVLGLHQSKKEKKGTVSIATLL